MSSQFWFIAVAIVGWGIGSYLSKISNTEMAPLVVAAVSLAVYIVVLPIAIVVVKPDLTITPLGFWMTILGSLFMCVGSLGFAYALRNGGEVGLTTTLCALYPALTLLLSFFFLGEQMSLRKGFGMVLAMVSIYILSQK